MSTEVTVQKMASHESGLGETEGRGQPPAKLYCPKVELKWLGK